MKKPFALCLIIVLALTPVFAKLVVTEADGGSNHVELSPSIILNEESSLSRTWITLNDDRLPLQIIGTPGVKVEYHDGGRYSNSEYRYVANYTLKSTKDIVAYEIRFVVFDVYDEHMTNLVANEIVDIKAGSPVSDYGIWRILSENDASEALSSIAYISRVRTSDGMIYTADNTAIADYLSSFSVSFEEDDLKDKD